MISEINEDYSLFVQKIELTVFELEKKITLTKKEKNRYSKLKNEKRKIEWLGTRYLLQYFFNKNSIIEYNENGKPKLSTGEQISISHSYGVVGILISNKKYLGIDIERKREKIDRIKHKYLNSGELDFVEKSDNKTQTLTIFWSCKEALLKMYGKTDLIFDEQIFVNISDKVIIGQIKTSDFNLQTQLQNKIIDEFVIIWAVS